MKRLVCLILAVLMLLTLCSCAGQNPSNATSAPTENDDRIYITKDNYSKYLKISAWMETGYYNGYGDSTNMAGQLIGFRAVDATLQTSGVSDNFNYTDISITVRITFQYDTGKTMEHTLTLDNMDITGKGSVSEQVYGGAEIEVTPGFKQKSSYEIIDISGYIEPA